MNWIRKHFKQIIYISFLFPILLVAFVSISHVTKWYAIGNPLSWAIYLSVAVEIGALSSLAAIVGKMGKAVYFPFILVTLIQFIGNVFFSYQYIKIDNQVFLDWVDLVSSIFSFVGVEPTDLIAHKRIASFLLGGLLPVMSLTFLGLLVKFEEKDWDVENTTSKNETQQNIKQEDVIDAKDIVGEISKIRLNEEELNELEKILQKFKPITNRDNIPPIEDINPYEPEPVIEIEPIPEPSIEIEPIPEPVIEIEPVSISEPVIEIEPISEAVIEIETISEPVIEIEPISEPSIEIEPISEAVVDPVPEPELIIEPISKLDIEQNKLNDPAIEHNTIPESVISSVKTFLRNVRNSQRRFNR